MKNKFFAVIAALFILFAVCISVKVSACYYCEIMHETTAYLNKTGDRRLINRHEQLFSNIRKSESKGKILELIHGFFHPTRTLPLSLLNFNEIACRSMHNICKEDKELCKIVCSSIPKTSYSEAYEELCRIICSSMTKTYSEEYKKLYSFVCHQLLRQIMVDYCMFGIEEKLN